MQVNLLWTGRAYYSLENCLVMEASAGFEIRSTIIGLYQEKIYQVDYHIRTNAAWETMSADISCRYGNALRHIVLEREGQGRWKENGKEAAGYKDCIDIDISLTPFTNTLPIRRLQLKPGDSRELKVVYCDLLNGQTHPVYQRYTCLNVEEYHYENIPNDFEATIRVDQSGFVVDYPGLFVRTAIS